MELNQPPDFVTEFQNISKQIKIGNNPPTISEIKETIKHLNSKKAANDVKPELLKYAAESSELLQELESLTDKIWHTQKLPDNFSHSRLVTICKG